MMRFAFLVSAISLAACQGQQLSTTAQSEPRSNDQIVVVADAINSALYMQILGIKYSDSGQFKSSIVCYEIMDSSTNNAASFSCILKKENSEQFNLDSNVSESLFKNIIPIEAQAFPNYNIKFANVTCNVENGSGLCTFESFKITAP